MNKGNLSVFLIPARTSADYWHKLIFKYASEIRFLKGGIQFPGYEHKAPFPMVIVILEPNRRVVRHSMVVGDYESFVWK